MEIVQAVKKLKSISRERLNFRRRPIFCTTLYRNPMQARNFGGTFDQLFLRIFLSIFHRRCLSTFSIPWCKKVKNDQNSNQGGGPALRLFLRVLSSDMSSSTYFPLFQLALSHTSTPDSTDVDRRSLPPGTMSLFSLVKQVSFELSISIPSLLLLR